MRPSGGGVHDEGQVRRQALAGIAGLGLLSETRTGVSGGFSEERGRGSGGERGQTPPRGVTMPGTAPKEVQSTVFLRKGQIAVNTSVNTPRRPSALEV